MEEISDIYFLRTGVGYSLNINLSDIDLKVNPAPRAFYAHNRVGYGIDHLRFNYTHCLYTALF